MNFGQAIEALKAGKRVARSGWNGKGMWLALLVPGGCGQTICVEPFVPRDVSMDGVIGDSWRASVDPCIAMKTAGNTIQPGWLASQADILAEDWGVVQ